MLQAEVICCVFQPANGYNACRLLVKIICFCVKTSFFIFFRHKRKKVIYVSVDQRFGANFKNPFFAKFGAKFVTFLHFFSFLTQKIMKMTIMTSVWDVQHPNASQNIQIWSLMKMQASNSDFTDDVVHFTTKEHQNIVSFEKDH